MNEGIFYLKTKFLKWKIEIWEHKYLLLLSLVFLIIAGILDYYSGIYTNRVGSAVSPDIILDNIPPVNFQLIFTYGYLFVLAVLFFYPLFFKVKSLHKVISQFSLLIMIRSIFICFTHLKAPVDAIAVKFPWIISHASFNNDLFFSGHVAVPFLGFWLFNEEKIKYFFLFSSLIMAVVVLFMHVHYSIDVFSAFFIAYGSYKIGEWLFRKVNR